MVQRQIDWSNPFRQMSMGVLRENARMHFRKKTGIIIFTEGSAFMSHDDFKLKVNTGAGAFEVSIHYDDKEWKITKLY